MCVIKNPPRSR